MDEELKPIGFTRSLVRNLLRVVDGFLSYLPGLIPISLTDRWQRLGDLAAGSIVIEKGGVPEEQPGVDTGPAK